PAWQTKCAVPVVDEVIGKTTAVGDEWQSRPQLPAMAKATLIRQRRARRGAINQQRLTAVAFLQKVAGLADIQRQPLPLCPEHGIAAGTRQTVNLRRRRLIEQCERPRRDRRGGWLRLRRAAPQQRCEQDTKPR